MITEPAGSFGRVSIFKRLLVFPYMEDSLPTISEPLATPLILMFVEGIAEERKVSEIATSFFDTR